MAWRGVGDKPLSEPNAEPMDWCIYAALAGDELINKKYLQTKMTRGYPAITIIARIPLASFTNMV